MAGGRPRKTLLERVLEGSFRPVRYGELLAGELLPEEPPFAGDMPADGSRARPPTEEYGRLIWEALRDWQSWYQLHTENYEQEPNSFDEDNMRDIAEEFSWLVHHLHGGRRPRWFTERLEHIGYDVDYLPFLYRR